VDLRLNWSAIDNHSLAGRALRAPLRLLPPSAVMKIRRGPAKGLKWIAGSSEHGCWLGTYELPKQNLLERLVRPGMTVYDIGAQAGFYTLCLSRIVGETGRVFAFEPLADNVRNLLEHVRMNGLRNVRIVQAAVAGCSGLRGFTTDQNAFENALAGGDSGLLVPTVSLDLLSLPPPNLIKMDIEGGESEALRGSRRILRENRPVVLVALHSREHARFCGGFLKSLGYKVLSVSQPLAEPQPLDDEIYALPKSESATSRG
jgi:FkbM family methyltransferase